MRFTLFALVLTFTKYAQNTISSFANAARSITKYPYVNYSFDYSAHNIPIAYSSIDNTVELFTKVKLNPKVPSRGGAYVLDNPLD